RRRQQARQRTSRTRGWSKAGTRVREPIALHWSETKSQPVQNGAQAESRYAALQEAVQIMRAATTSDEALHALYTLLHARFGVEALALETIHDATTYYRPYGESAALTTAPANSGAHPHSAQAEPRAHVFPLECKFAPYGQIIFVLAPDSPATPDFLAALVASLTMLLDQEALAERVQESEERAKQRISEVATIYEIGQAIDQIDRKRLLHLITDRAALLMDAQACSLMLVNEETGTLRVEASHGLPEDALEHEQKIGEGIAGRVAQTDQPMLILSASNDPRLTGVTLRPEIGSSMLVPMKNQEGRVLGVLS